MKKPRLAWAITGSGHYIEECLAFLLSLDDVDLHISCKYTAMAERPEQLITAFNAPLTSLP